MSLINTEIKPFKAQAYHNGKFIEVTDADLRGKWSVVCFYPADFTFVCPTELGDLADHYEQLQKMEIGRASVGKERRTRGEQGGERERGRWVTRGAAEARQQEHA